MKIGVEDSSQGSRVPGGRGKHRDAPGRGHAPQPQKDREAHGPKAPRGSAAQALTLTRATFWLLEPRRRAQRLLVSSGRRRRRRRQQRNSNKSSERLPGSGGCSYGSQSSAGPGSVRSTRGGGGSMWPVPPIHKSSAEHRWRAGLSRAERTGGRGLRRTRRRPQENKRARSREPGSCVRGRELRRAGCSAAGAAPGRGGGLGRGVLRGAVPGGRGCSGETGTGFWRRSVPGGGRTAEDTCRLPGAAPTGSLSAAPRRRVPAIWRRREPRHLRVCPSPGGAPALARY